MDIEAIQSALREAKLDGWLFYDHHRRDPLAYRILKISPALCTRRWYYLLPAIGDPAKLVHRIESENLNGLPGTHHVYSAWDEQREKLKQILKGRQRVAMQYSPLNDIPYIGLIDAGTVELVRSCGVEIASSADLVQLFEARWSPEALSSHLDAGKGVHAALRCGFGMIREAAKSDGETDEYAVQQEILRSLAQHGLKTDEPPTVAVNRNTSNPHYSPGLGRTFPIRRNDFVLIDVWAKFPTPGAVYFDITWTGFVGEAVPRRYTELFEIVREARDTAIDLVKSSVRAGRPLRGSEVDDAARALIRQRGYGDYFVHRTGHSLGEDVHGNGANMDNFETRDTRSILPRTCFSIEPGIYLPEFGIRSEVNVYVGDGEAQVTGEIQRAIVPILRSEASEIGE